MQSMLYLAICSGITLHTASFSFRSGVRSRSSWDTERRGGCIRNRGEKRREEERREGGRKKKHKNEEWEQFWGKRTLKSVLKECTATKQRERKEIQSRQRAAGQGKVASRKAKEQESMYQWGVLSTSYFNGPWQKTFGILVALSSPQINKWRRDDCWRLKENENRPK